MSELLHFIQDREAAFKNQSRLASLYSNFSAQKTLNPSGYAANLSAWKRALFHACRKGKVPAVAAANTQSIKRRTVAHEGGKEEEEEEAAATDYLSLSTGEELARALELRPYGRPTGLEEVIKDATEKKELVPLNEYLQQHESIYSKRWIPTPWEVVRWGIRTLTLGLLYSQPSDFTIGRFVVVENVELASQAVLELQRTLDNSSTAGIYSLKTFTSTFERVLGQGSVLSAADMQVLLRFMSRDRPSLTYDAETGTIKFASSEASKPPPIEASDVSIAQVKTLQLSLSQAVPPLEARYAELDARVRDAVAKKQISAAKSFLKARKLVECTLEQRRANLLQVEESLHAIDNAANNVALVDAMKESTKVLRDLNSRVGGVEGVERVTDAMREEMATVEDVNRVMAEPVSDTVIDEEEVDEEFEALLAAEKAKEDAAKEELRKKQAEAEEEERRKKAEDEEKQRLKKLEEDEVKERLRRLEEWEKFQKEAKKAEETKAAEEQAAKEELERRFADLKKQDLNAEDHPEASEQDVESTREGVQDIRLKDNGARESSKKTEEKPIKEPVAAS
ncbi:uncharacterized protein PV09_07957 [Verruconis gallopava]|uniref:Uncharacterized protein n=1 Tax=Verruconis gallopava TaxID=253628 RepID=A0A0D1YHU2_9PEZI|nr:uncharacterized protein PV09_07957 [Verruconis gallopava]KIW00427.1 hypothetical protein PV09_07957 [Verruconis gallopava]